MKPLPRIAKNTPHGMRWLNDEKTQGERYLDSLGRIRINGLPDWAPLSETRHAQIIPVFKVVCTGCDASHLIYLGSDPETAQRLATAHDTSHSNTLGECCMYSRAAVCSCGQVLV